MDRLSIDLPSEELAWAQSRVAAGEKESLDAYFRDLAARDRADAGAEQFIDEALAEGEASGIEPREHKQIFNELRAKYQL
jgi:Arc/MetJ-type ribon-helix-helix transcriptional regulator